MSIYKGNQIIAGTRDNRANVDLSNLSTTGEKHFLNKQQITNCILNDPQNIKLELNNGTLTLKAGSVVCVPNGFETDGTTPKFDEVVLSTDTTCRRDFATGTDVIFVTPINIVDGWDISVVFSGASPQPSSVMYQLWYDTTNNIIKSTSDGGTTWTSGHSFPIALAGRTLSTGFTSIDQTFQSIGYIGSTVFVRKGLKVLIPNGRNADGSLNNIEVTVTRTNTFNPTDTATQSCNFTVDNNGNVGRLLSPNWMYYNDKNLWISNAGAVLYRCAVAKAEVNNNIISNFQPYTAVNILKYSDKSQISGWGMPYQQLNLSAGASGSIYTAPANGWYCISVVMTNTNASIRLVADVATSIRDAAWNSSSVELYMPIRKGAYCTLTYQGVSINWFRFFYAYGEIE